TGLLAIVGWFLLSAGAPARANVNVTKYFTEAETNAWTFGPPQYFDDQQLTNVSPAVIDVHDDWTGTNLGGSTPTWHWIASVRANTVTTSTSDRFTATGAGSFSIDRTTTQG